MSVIQVDGGSLRGDRMIAATVTSGFAWFAALLPLSLGLGPFFGPPGVGQGRALETPTVKEQYYVY